MLKKIYSFCNIFLLMAFALNAMAFAQTQVNSGFTQVVAEKINAYKTVDELLNTPEALALPFTKDAISYFKQEGVLNQKMPKIEVSNGELIFIQEQIRIQFDVNGDMTLKMKDNVASFTKKMTFKEISDQIEKCEETKKMSYLRFFISEAHAGIREIRVLAFIGSIVALVASALAYDQKEFEKTVMEFAKKCDSAGQAAQLKDIFGREDFQESYGKVINEFERYKLSRCTVKTAKELLHDKQTLACVSLMKSIQCLKRANELKNSDVDSDRLGGKEIPVKEYKKQEKPAPSSNHQ
jgi:citrate lyase gamma subunit